jgi:hypothetical protein
MSLRSLTDSSKQAHSQSKKACPSHLFIALPLGGHSRAQINAIRGDVTRYALCRANSNLEHIVDGVILKT